MRVAQAVLADVLLQGLRQPRGEATGVQQGIGVETGERTTLLRQPHRGRIGGIAHGAGDACRPPARRLAVVAQTQHDQRIPQASETEADAALAAGLFALFGQRPRGQIEHVVQHAHRDRHHPDQALDVEVGGGFERPLDQSREVDRAQAAGAVRRQRLLPAGIGCRDRLAAGEVVVGVDAVQEQQPGLAMPVGIADDAMPQGVCRQAGVAPEAVGSLPGPRGLLRVARLGGMQQIDPACVSSARMNSSVMPTERLKCCNSPPALAAANASMSG